MCVCVCIYILAEDLCVSVVCQNDGICVEIDGSTSCHCQAGYEGEFCEISKLSFQLHITKFHHIII